MSSSTCYFSRSGTISSMIEISFLTIINTTTIVITTSWCERPGWAHRRLMSGSLSTNCMYTSTKSSTDTMLFSGMLLYDVLSANAAYTSTKSSTNTMLFNGMLLSGAVSANCVYTSTKPSTFIMLFSIGCSSVAFVVGKRCVYFYQALHQIYVLHRR